MPPKKPEGLKSRPRANASRVDVAMDATGRKKPNQSFERKEEMTKGGATKQTRRPKPVPAIGSNIL
jgi:hypothetical protein